MVQSLLSEAWRAVRTVQRAKTIAGLAVATVALVVCGVTLIASVISATLVDPGPYRTPSRVVGLQYGAPSLPFPSIYFPHDDYLTLRDAATGPDGMFEALLPLGIAYVMMTGSGEPAHLNAGVMPGATFERLGVAPLVGRTLTPDDDRPDAPSVIVIGEDVWRTSFGSDPGVIGRIVRIEDRPHEIVGVMPRRFTWGVLTAWLPMRLDVYGSLTGRFVQITGWLRDGVTEARALERMQAAFSNVAAAGSQYPPSPALSFGHPAVPAVRDEVRQSLWLLLLAVSLLAVVGCVNVAALLLARVAGRLKELSIRTSLGASRWQIVRAQVVETLLLAGAGALLGILLAHTLLPALVAALPRGVIPPGAVVSVDARVLGWMTAATVAIALACATVPALFVTRADVEPLLRGTATGSALSPTAGRLWRVLVGVEVAVAMTLLVLTTVFGRGLLALKAEPLHYSPDRVVALGLTISEHRYPAREQEVQFLLRAAEQVRGVPGVADAAIAYPSSPRSHPSSTFTLSGRTVPADERVGWRLAGASFFEAFGIPTVRGRMFSADDERAGRPLAVVNETFARQFGGDGDVLGRHIRVGVLRAIDGGDAPPFEIVGVVGDVPNDVRVPGRVAPEVSVPATAAVRSRNWFIVARAAAGDVTDLVKPMQTAVWTLDPDQAFRSIRTEHEALWAARFGWPQFRALLLGLFAVLALSLVAAGTYGILSYSTSRDARNIGIRLAISSDRAAIVRHVLARTSVPVLAGMAIGIGIAAAGGGFVRAFVGSVSPWDPLAYLAALATLLLVTGLACYLPARRASHVDPAVVLRD